VHRVFYPLLNTLRHFSHIYLDAVEVLFQTFFVVIHGIVFPGFRR
jgi:hypothetical protein